MNRPENGILIAPRIDKLEDGSFEILIRRWTFADGRAISKEVLLANGEWEIISEGGRYPKDAFLPVTHRIVDRAEEARLTRDWELQNTIEEWNNVAIEMGYGNT